MPGKVINLLGRKFGRLKVVALAGRRASHALWECKCSCGATTLVQSDQLRRGGTKSCGCLHREVTARGAHLKHGRTIGGRPSREYRAWYGMMQRTTNPNSSGYVNYGGRGISVCERWRRNFLAFLSDMGRCPPGKSLDRWPNNDGNYEPGNCRWATPSEQARNKRKKPKPTHCAQGHEFRPENTIEGKDGVRRCRICNALRCQRYRVSGTGSR